MGELEVSRETQNHRTYARGMENNRNGNEDKEENEMERLMVEVPQ